MLGDYSDFDGNNFYELYKTIPLKIIPFIEKIIDGANLEFEDSYGSVDIDDAPFGYYLFNIGAQTKRIQMGYFFSLTEEDFKTELEKEFFRFHQFITDWTEEMYSQYVEKYEPKPGADD